MSGVTIRGGSHRYHPTGREDITIRVDRELSQEQVDVLYQMLSQAGAEPYSVVSVTLYDEAPPHINWAPGRAPWERQP